jgi:hypothetical protein
MPPAGANGSIWSTAKCHSGSPDQKRIRGIHYKNEIKLNKMKEQYEVGKYDDIFKSVTMYIAAHIRLSLM